MDNLIGFLGGDAIMETLEEKKILIQEYIEQFYCNKCGRNYQGYCLNCSSLSHILNNITPNFNPEPGLNTIPKNILEIREISRGSAVIALKTLPQGIILGPFEGIAPIESTTGLQWKIKDMKFAHDENGNWMKYIESVAKASLRNLDIFQIDGILYFETNREIHEGEELLVCCGEEKEEMLELDKEEVFYLVPVKKEGYPKVFACTLCCLGFRLESCLVEHKSKCTQGDPGDDFEDLEIIQCRNCKVWLEQQEHLESHVVHCLDNSNRLCHNRNLSDFTPTYIDEEEQVHENVEITPSIDVNASYSTPSTEPIDYNNVENIGTTHSNTNERKYKCSECNFQTNWKGNLKIHLGTHTNVKNVQCDICKQRFGRKDNLKVHIRNKHSNTNEKEYKCSQCSFQTNWKNALKTHLRVHTGVRDFQCDICKQRFAQKTNVARHIRNKHSNTNEKEYKCSQCSFQTNWKNALKTHLLVHTGVRDFQCDICKQRFTLKCHMTCHIRYKHSNTNEKEYKCSQCSYETNNKSNLKNHLATHTNVKNVQCDICKQRFGRKDNLKVHIRNKHSNTNEKEYKCSQCSFQTNWKCALKTHLLVHTGVRDFQCDICKQRFAQKTNVARHIRNKHSNTNEKEYKCSECSYETNIKGNLKIHLARYKSNLKNHLATHTNVKNVQCDICKQRFGRKDNLKVHIRNKHSNTNEKEYKCSQCSFQTNWKCALKTHLLVHTGVRDFQCDICKQRFAQKTNVARHIRNKHSNTNEKEYKCSECSYETNIKGNLKIHLARHNDMTMRYL